jgi:hypothetical protein
MSVYCPGVMGRRRFSMRSAEVPADQNIDGVFKAARDAEESYIVDRIFGAGVGRAATRRG